MIDDFLKSLGQLSDPRFRGVLWRALGLTAALLAALFFAASFLIGAIGPVSILGWTPSWGDAAATALAYGATLVGLGFLMLPAAAMFIGFFLEDIADAVEARHYPALSRAPRTPFWPMVWDGVRFAAVVVFANLAALAAYLALAPLAPAIFLALNGYLFGRQYFELTAARRVGFAAARALRRRHRLTIWAAGAAMAAALAIPVVNLIVPVLGVATFTHSFHRLRGAP